MLGYKRLERVLDDLHRDELQQRREARVRAQLVEVRALLTDLASEDAGRPAVREISDKTA
jgi:hypothetical protein